MQVPLLKDLVIIFCLSIGVLYTFHRLRVPAIVGFLLTGILVGPHGLGLISAIHEVEILAEIGVVLLLFTICLEFSLKSLLQIKRFLLVGGSLQGILTYLAGFIIAREIGLPFRESIFIGFLISFSSTAIVLKLLQERAEIDSPHGRTALAILIFQDIIIVPIMLLTPFLAGTGGNVGEAIGILLAKSTGIIL
ncbi:MAG: cation:proton antiporter, partial [Deltaproteobacteria bacterium]|nr:cation:proton antiporter [Deltaproteobacteria bacterium]